MQGKIAQIRYETEMRQKDPNWLPPKTTAVLLDEFSKEKPRETKLKKHIGLLKETLDNGELSDATAVMQSLIQILGGKGQARFLLKDEKLNYRAEMLKLLEDKEVSTQTSYPRLRKVGSAILGVLTFVPRMIIGMVALIRQSYGRSVRLGSTSAEKEQWVARPSPFRRFYAEKKKLYDDIDTLNAFADLKDPKKEIIDYLKSNTFYFLGGLIQKGNLEAAEKLIKLGYFNEVSPRLLSMLSLSPLSNAEEFRLYRALLRRSFRRKNWDDQLLVVQDLKLKNPEMAKTIVAELEPGIHKRALAALLGDESLFFTYMGDGIYDLKTKTNQSILHLACQGGNANIIKKLADNHPNAAQLFLEEDRPASFLGRVIQTANRPLDFMNIETANALDKLYGFNSNQPGSFSIGVNYVLYVRTPTQLKNLLEGAALGKLTGGQVISAAMPLISRIGVSSAGIQYGASHLMSLCAENMIMNTTLYSGATVGAMAPQSFLGRFYRGIKAEGLGLDDSLAQLSGVRAPTRRIVAAYRTYKELELGSLPNPEQRNFEENLLNRLPKQAFDVLKGDMDRNIQITNNLIRRFCRVPFMSPKFREDILFQLIKYQREESKKPDDGNKMVEALLESQLEFGSEEINKSVKKVIRSHLTDRSKLPSVGKRRSYMLIATRLGDMELMDEIASKAPDRDSMWLDTFVRRDESPMFGHLVQLERGNTLMHVAAARGNAQFLKDMRDRWMEHYFSRLKQSPDKSVSHRLPVATLLQKASAPSDGSGRMRMELSDNAYSVRNSLGQTPAEMLPPHVARELDELLKLDSNQPGSFLQVCRDRLAASSLIFGSQVACALPSQIILNLGLAHVVAVSATTAHAIGSAHGGPVVGILADTLVQFAVGSLVAMGELAIGVITGQESMKLILKAQDIFRGYGNEVSQLNPKILDQAKSCLKEKCLGLIREDNDHRENRETVKRIFAREIKAPAELIDLLEELNLEIPGLRILDLTLNPSPATGEGLKTNFPSPLAGEGDFAKAKSGEGSDF